jgi:hypothetical protein
MIDPLQDPIEKTAELLHLHQQGSTSSFPNNTKVLAQEIKDTFLFFPSTEQRKDPQVQCKNCHNCFVYTSLQKLRSHIAGRSINGTRYFYSYDHVFVWIL